MYNQTYVSKANWMWASGMKVKQSTSAKKNKSSFECKLSLACTAHTTFSYYVVDPTSHIKEALKWGVSE